MGRAEVIGRPTTYGTTTAFLEYFGLGSLEDLPAADELRRIVVERPPSLATVDANLATVPQPELFTPTTGEISTEGTAAPQTPAPAADAAPVKPSEAEATAPDAEASQPEVESKPEADAAKPADETPSAPEIDEKNS
jgi:segregation and condensation protein B